MSPSATLAKLRESEESESTQGPILGASYSNLWAFSANSPLVPVQYRPLDRAAGVILATHFPLVGL